MAMLPSNAARAQANNGCTFNPPKPVLQAGAYAQQTFSERKDNGSVETALLEDGTRIEIHRSQCVDSIYIQYVFLLPASTEKKSLSFWSDFAARRIGELKHVKDLPIPPGQLIVFLARVPTLPAQDGRVMLCKNDAPPLAGEAACRWETLGSFVFVVKDTLEGIRISAGEDTSG